jgi:hypothetical protein
LIPPEITTSKKEDMTTQATTELTTAISKEKDTVEVVVQTTMNNPQRISCKQGEYLPSTYCNKVSNINLNIRFFIIIKKTYQ